jgi:hypothetical protein
MVENTVRIGGAISFWTLSEQTVRQRLKEGLEALGLGKFTPEPRTPAAALKDALESLYTLPTQLVRPLKTKEGFTVVEERRGADENAYPTVATAKIDKQLQISLAPYNHAQAQELARRFNEQLGLLRPSQVTASLVAVLDSLGATRLRPGGAIYWLPAHRLDDWRAVCDVVEAAGKDKPNNLYVLQNVYDDEAVRAVRDAITSEVMAAAARLNAEIRSGELQERALENRRREAEELRRKISLYEGLLSLGLEQLHQAVDHAESAAAVAALQLTIAAGLPEESVA